MGLVEAVLLSAIGLSLIVAAGAIMNAILVTNARQANENCGGNGI